MNRGSGKRGATDHADRISVHPSAISVICGSLFPLPLLLLVSCTSIVTRPNIRPFLQASFDTLVADPAALADSARAAIASLGMDVRAFSAAEGYLETRWYDLQTHQSHSGNVRPERLVRLRVWTDLVTPRESQIAVETVRRATIDPSVPDREVEIVADSGSAGDSLTQGVLRALRSRFPHAQPPERNAGR